MVGRLSRVPQLTAVDGSTGAREFARYVWGFPCAHLSAQARAARPVVGGPSGSLLHGLQRIRWNLPSLGDIRDRSKKTHASLRGTQRCPRVLPFAPSTRWPRKSTRQSKQTPTCLTKLGTFAPSGAPK